MFSVRTSLKICLLERVKPLPKDKFLHLFLLKTIADDNLMKPGSDKIERIVGKGENVFYPVIDKYHPFSYIQNSVFKRLVLQTRKNHLGKG